MSSHIITLLKYIFARHGVPKIVVSDRDPQFSSEIFKHFANEWNFSHKTTSPLYLQSNSMV